MLILITAIPDNGLQLYRMSCAVRSVITATAELFVISVRILSGTSCSWSCLDFNSHPYIDSCLGLVARVTP